MFKSLLTSAALIAFSMNAYADWHLKSDLSSVHFVSVKKEHIAETHHFKKVIGSIDNAGKLLISIDLASVETGIEIRNKRMRDMLFDLANFKSARITADLSDVLTETIKSGKAIQFTTTQSATLSLHGIDKEINVHLLVSYDGGKKLSASVTQPILIKAREFGLEGGVKALQKIAGLPSITTTVPVNASLVFSK